MQDYNLTKTDYDEINNLIKLTRLIDDLYFKLYELEIENKKETEEYKKLIGYLNILLEKESNKYKECNLKVSKCVGWVNYLLDDKLPPSVQLDFETILNQDYSHRTIKRILNRLLNIIESSKIYNETISNDLKNDIGKRGIKLPKEAIDHSVTSSVRIRKSLESDIHNLYLSLLEEKINDGVYKSIKNDLINSKYNFSFMNKDIELGMIANNFKTSSTLYIGSKMISQLQYIDESLYNFFKDSYGIKMLMEQIVELLKIEDADYNNRKKLTTSILRQNLINAILLTISNEIINDIKREYKVIIAKEFYTLNPTSNDMSKGLINYYLENAVNEKNKLNVLSLKK